MNDSWKATLRHIAERTLSLILAGIVITLVFIALALWLGSGATKQQQASLDQQAALLSAIGCELGVPAIDGTRDPALLQACWTDEGLEPPTYFEER